jgi:hypothetical protein
MALSHHSRIGWKLQVAIYRTINYFNSVMIFCFGVLGLQITAKIVEY